MARAGKRFGKTSQNYRLEDIWADAGEIEGAIRKMEKSYPPLSDKVFVITEGPYDYEFYSRLLNMDICEIRFANSRKNVVSIMETILEKMPEKAEKSVIGIVDRDFSFFKNKDEEEDSCSKNLFLTDTHDIETMMLSDKLIEEVLSYYERMSAGGNFQRKALLNLREAGTLSLLVRCSRMIGLSLYINEKYGLNMTFKHINCKKRNMFLDFTDPGALGFYEERLMDLIEKRNETRFEAFKEALSKELVRDAEYFDHPMQICRGHDLMCVLLADINSNYPQRTGEKVRQRDLERTFRKFYDRDEFFRTELFRSLNKWQTLQNPASKSLFEKRDNRRKTN